MRSRSRKMILHSLVLLGISLGASHLLAKHYGANTPWPKKKTPGQTTQPTTAPAAATTAPVVDDSVARAQDSMLAAQTRARHRFESSPEWSSAQAALSKAQSDAQSANASVGSSIRNQPEYISADAQVATDEEKLQQARENGADSSEIAADASLLMTARSALNQLQARALAAAPAVVAARDNLATANFTIEQLRKQETAFVQADPDWKAARKAYDDARSKVAGSAD